MSIITVKTLLQYEVEVNNRSEQSFALHFTLFLINQMYLIQPFYISSCHSALQTHSLKPQRASYADEVAQRLGKTP